MKIPLLGIGNNNFLNWLPSLSLQKIPKLPFIIILLYLNYFYTKNTHPTLMISFQNRNWDEVYFIFIASDIFDK